MDRLLQAGVAAALFFMIGTCHAAGSSLFLLQQQMQEARTTADLQAQEQSRLRAETLARRDRVAQHVQALADARQGDGFDAPRLNAAIADLNAEKAALEAAARAEQAGVFAGLQAEAARRRTRQAVAEVTAGYLAEGEALEQASVRTARGEVIPSASDLLVCEQDACDRITAIEHAAMAQIGAVADSFSWVAWTLARQAGISVLPLNPGAPRLRVLWQAVRAARQEADRTSQALARARRALDDAQDAWNAAYAALNAATDGGHSGAQLTAAVTALEARTADLKPLAETHAQAMEDRTTAQHALVSAQDAIELAAALIAAQGRALKQAATLAEAGYALDADNPARACAGSACQDIKALEAAAFAIIGAVNSDIDLSRRSFAAVAPLVAQTDDGLVFTLP